MLCAAAQGGAGGLFHKSHLPLTHRWRGRGSRDRSKRGRCLTLSIPTLAPLRGIDRALRAEWRCSTAQIGRAFERGLSESGRGVDDAGHDKGKQVVHLDCCTVACQRLPCRCIFVPRDLGERVVCHWCGDDFPQKNKSPLQHPSTWPNKMIASEVGPDIIGGLEWLASHFGSRSGVSMQSAG